MKKSIRSALLVVVTMFMFMFAIFAVGCESTTKTADVSESSYSVSSSDTSFYLKYLDINDVYAKCYKNTFLIDWIHSLGLSFKMDKLIIKKEDLYKKEMSIKEILDYNLLYLKGYFSNELYYDVLGKTIYDENMQPMNLNTFRNLLLCSRESILNMPNVTERTVKELDSLIASLNLQISNENNKDTNVLLKAKK